jgi:hypothetical protein
MREITVEQSYEVREVLSLAGAIEEFMALRQQGFWSFRGQRLKEWDLGLHGINADAPIHDYLRQFQRRCMEFPRPNYIEEFDHWRWLFYAQHHRLKTRLLDWTTNPLVALYFAVENILSRRDDNQDFGAVWALLVAPQHFKPPEEIGNVEDVKEWLMVNPPPVTHRLARQSGKFSYHPAEDGLTPLSRMPRRPSECLIKFEIGLDKGRNPSAKVRQQLGIMNVHHASLFPDPDGIAEFINHEWPIIAHDRYLGLDHCGV